jgi:hypothetical protein
MLRSFQFLSSYQLTSGLLQSQPTFCTEKSRSIRRSAGTPTFEDSNSRHLQQVHLRISMHSYSAYPLILIIQNICLCGEVAFLRNKGIISLKVPYFCEVNRNLIQPLLQGRRSLSPRAAHVCLCFVHDCGH